MGQIVADGHADAKCEAVGVAFEHGLHVSLGLGVERLIEVGGVFFGEANARAQGVLIVVFEDAAGGVDGAVDIALVAEINEVKCSNNVSANSIGLVIFAPVDVRTAGDTGGHEDVGGLDAVELGGYVAAVLNARFGKDDFYALFFEEGGHLTADPAGLSSVYEGFGKRGG